MSALGKREILSETDFGGAKRGESSGRGGGGVAARYRGRRVITGNRADWKHLLGGDRGKGEDEESQGGSFLRGLGKSGLLFKVFWGQSATTKLWERGVGRIKTAGKGL